jgi:type IV secretion system protein VirB9
MTIYTDKRVYSFDLRSVGELTPGKPSVFRSVFTYPAERNVRRKPVTPPEPIYTNYLVSGEGSFRPRWVQDNGRQTTFFLPADSPRPAIFKVGADKKEELINSRTVDDRVIVDGTSNFWVLRIGDEMICVGIDYAVKSKPKPVRKTEVLHAQR